VNFLYGLFPLRPWRDFLLRVHLDTCPACRAKLASREETQALLARAEGMRGGPPLWPRVAAAIGGEGEREEKGGERERGGSGQKWRRRAAVGVAAGLAAWCGILLWKGFRPEADLASAAPARFELKYVKIEGETAEAFVYQPHDSDMVIIWAGKKQSGGGS
jgi:anti-sigma factor RsiW